MRRKAIRWMEYDKQAPKRVYKVISDKSDRMCHSACQTKVMEVREAAPDSECHMARVKTTVKQGCEDTPSRQSVTDTIASQHPIQLHLNLQTDFSLGAHCLALNYLLVVTKPPPDRLTRLGCF
ncbi:hypothetical protein EGR_10904 [Echinococcus granulosus]|uniref:Uncharacterized protein n=1 Tax=Echinococcus granulosus TaxID=6210 RepID=W6TZR9_ECHGR|nr:hypothetical protein EGR_10904 [Echinococcus granulosus]EUB54238.1 hypothetical protein EGR_10904 [Echinococcus granulosus]